MEREQTDWQGVNVTAGKWKSPFTTSCIVCHVEGEEGWVKIGADRAVEELNGPILPVP